MFTFEVEDFVKNEGSVKDLKLNIFFLWIMNKICAHYISEYTV